MIVKEVFYAIQGEGLLAGTPSMFVRMAGDTPRNTWLPPLQHRWEPDPVELRLGPMLAEIRKQYCGHAVVTGDEPLNDPDIGVLTERLRSIYHYITIETTGAAFARVECDLMSITPRLATARRKTHSLPYQTDVIRQLITTYPYQLKFVVGKREEMKEVKDLVDELRADRARVLLIPAASKGKELKEQVEWILEACRFFVYRFSPRLQLMSPAERKTAGAMR